MRKLKLYLDTSVINFLFADDAPEKQRVTQEFFEDSVSQGKFDIYISDVVIGEIKNTKDIDKRNNLLEVIYKYNLNILSLSEEAIELTDEYLKQSVIPEKKVEDARHIAIATVSGCDMLLSWNYKHLANINKEKKIQIINIQQGYNYPVRLSTPMEVTGE